MSFTSSIRESYCGLCEQCQLSSPDFQEAVGKVIYGPVTGALAATVY
jgi:hypothetical protein